MNNLIKIDEDRKDRRFFITIEQKLNEGNFPILLRVLTTIRKCFFTSPTI